MPHVVCPWWLGYLLASPLRRLLEKPEEILDAYIRPGMMVLEPGPGMGFFTLELARQVGPNGRVVAVDIQPRMLAGVRKRASRAGLAKQIDARLATAGSLGISEMRGSFDFAFVYAVVHETPAPDRFFREIAEALKSGGSALFVEPAGHVTSAKFDSELRMAAEAGLTVVERPSISRSHAALLRR